MSKITAEEVKSKIILKEKYWENVYNTNCYAFALGLDVSRDDMPGLYQLGDFCYFIKGKDYYDSIPNKTYEKKLLLDLEALEIEHEEVDPNEPTIINITYDNNGDAIIEYSWLIALFRNEQENDFHFLRKTPNGVWYHKQGFSGYPNCHNDSGRIILRDPTEEGLFLWNNYVNTYRLKLTKKQ